jgi:hypothetical protein
MLLRARTRTNKYKKKKKEIVLSPLFIISDNSIINQANFI